MKVFHLDDARRARERVDAAPDRLSTRAALDTATAGIVVVAEACRRRHAVTGQLVGVTRGDGDHRWLALDAAPAGALDEDWIVLTIRDVTERIAARERKARSTATPAASEARFRALYKREHRMVRADGSVVSVLVDMTVVRDSDGRPTTTSCRSATSPIASAPKRRSRTRPSTTTSRACPTASCSSTG